VDSGVEFLQVITLSQQDTILVVVPVDHKRCIEYATIQLLDQSVQGINGIKSV
jgi:hypothetical protein